MRITVTVELRRPARRSVALVAGALLLLTPAVVLASHQFADVPNSHPFHNEIGWVADKDIANGFTDGTYKPSQAVTRQAMAAFLQRLGTASPMEEEPNDSFAEADLYPPAGPAMGGLMSDDLDYWRISHPGGDLRAETVGLDCFDATLSDTLLTLYNSNGGVILEGDDMLGGSHCSGISANLEKGDYFLRVQPWDNMTVPWYALTVEVDGSPLRPTR